MTVTGVDSSLPSVPPDADADADPDAGGPGGFGNLAFGQLDAIGNNVVGLKHARKIDGKANEKCHAGEHKRGAIGRALRTGAE